MAKSLYTEREYKYNYKVVKETLLRQKSKENYPLATLVGGQPGSGKSELTKYIKAENENTIVIDGDYIRNFHPHLEEIQEKYGIDYPKVTQPFVNRAVEQLIDELSKEKYNLIIEGTLRDIKVPSQTAEKLNDRKYPVDLYVIATNKQLSWESTIKRGDRMKENGEIPRYVDKEHHDRVADSLPETVEKLLKSDLFCSIVIMRRDHTIIYDNQIVPELSPKEILEKELSGEHVRSVKEIIEERDQSERSSKITLDEQIEVAKQLVKDEYEPTTNPSLHRVSVRNFEDDFER